MVRNDIVVGRWPFSILLTVPRLSGLVVRRSEY